MIEKERIKFLNVEPVKNGKYVIYWMQASQRAEYNHALEYSILQANKLKKPLFVYFGLCRDYPGANLRHYYFMLMGLKETRQALKKRGINMVILTGSPEKGLARLAHRACLVVTDRGYTRIQKQWRKTAAKKIKCALIQVESDCVVPVETASPKEEYAAATIRRKILEKILLFLQPVKSQKLLIGNFMIKGAGGGDIDLLLKKIKPDPLVPVSGLYKAGARAAKAMLRDFFREKLVKYSANRSDPSLSCESNMSPYLHFGQISPLYIALEALKTGEKINSPFLEELIVRRELALNFVNYNKNYDSFECLPNWAKKTLHDHESDSRPYLYRLEELEGAKTHDSYWNAAQLQMVKTGKMHNYMRMYWGKKVIEWSKSLKSAYDTLVYLNDKYELDGRDPNGYAGIAWCFGKHDRAWTEREIFGKIRFMNSKGLERKFDIMTYVNNINKL